MSILPVRRRQALMQPDRYTIKAMKPVRRAFLAALALAISSTGVSACTCAGRASACEQLGHSEAVFIGKSAIQEPYDIGPDQGLQRRVVFDLLESFRGTGEPQVTVVTGIGGGDCGFPFEDGKSTSCMQLTVPRDCRQAYALEQHRSMPFKRMWHSYVRSRPKVRVESAATSPRSTRCAGKSTKEKAHFPAS